MIKKPIYTDYSALTKKIETNLLSSKLMIIKICKYKNIFSKDYTKNWPREIFITDSVLKTNPRAYKIKDLNGEKIIKSCYETELLLSIA